MKILVAGMGNSGYAAAELAMNNGHTVFACDRALAQDLKVDLTPLLSRGMVFYGGSESPGLLEGMEALVLSPGVPRASSLVRSAVERGIPVMGELEWGFRHAKGQVAAVTGSNGKSTTTTLVGQLLAVHFADVRTGGNLGTPFCAMAAGSTEDTWFVLEASSFQLESMDTFRARVAVLLNITPDHQDRYAAFEDYAAAKARIFVNQGPEDFAVFSATDPLADAVRRGVLREARSRSPPPWSFPTGAFPRDGQAVWRRARQEEVLFDLADLPLPGAHNLEDALAACLAARCAGVPAGQPGARPPRLHGAAPPAGEGGRRERGRGLQRLQGHQYGLGAQGPHGLRVGRHPPPRREGQGRRLGLPRRRGEGALQAVLAFGAAPRERGGRPRRGAPRWRPSPP